MLLGGRGGKRPGRAARREIVWRGRGKGMITGYHRGDHPARLDQNSEYACASFVASHGLSMRISFPVISSFN